MTVGKNSCIAPDVAVGSGAGAPVGGKWVEVASMGIVAEGFGATAVTYVGVVVDVGDGGISCGADTRLAAGTHPEKMINATGRRTRRRLMEYRLGGTSAWRWV